MYYKSVGRNSTLILGLTPDPHGLLPQKDVKRLEEFGNAIRHNFANPLGTTQGNGTEISLQFSAYWIE